MRYVQTIVLSLVVPILFAGCVTDLGGEAPECPLWSEEAILDLSRLVGEGNYRDLQYAIGRQEVHCLALEHYNRGGADCDPDEWDEWMALLLSLECSPN